MAVRDKLRTTKNMSTLRVLGYFIYIKIMTIKIMSVSIS